MLQLAKGLRVEELRGEAVVVDKAGGEVHRVIGDGVRALLLLRDGVEIGDVPEELHAAMDELVGAGFVADGRRWTRRKFILAGGAAWAAATVTTFALAEPAAAASVCMGTPPTSPQNITYDSGAGLYTTGNTTTMLRIWVWGAGGGGGGNERMDGSSGAGGGGGGFAQSDITVTPCTNYGYQVGGGGIGAATAPTGVGGNGGASRFVQGATILVSADGGTGGGLYGAGRTGGNMFITSGSNTAVRNGGTGGQDANEAGGGGGGSGGGGSGGGGSGEGERVQAGQ